MNTRILVRDELAGISRVKDAGSSGVVGVHTDGAKDKTPRRVVQLTTDLSDSEIEAVKRSSMGPGFEHLDAELNDTP